MADEVLHERREASVNAVGPRVRGRDPRTHGLECFRDELVELPADVKCKAVIALRTPFLDAERHLVLCELRS